MKRGRILVLLGIILGLVTTVAAFLILKGSGDQSTQPTEIPKTKVLVAVQNIAIADPIDPATVELREFEQTQVPADAVLSPADIAGKLAAQDIAQGQILRQTMLTDKQTIVNKGVNASFLIPPGKVAVAVPITELSSVAYALQAGDSIDMLVTIELVTVDPELQIQEPVQHTGAQGEVAGTQTPRMVSQLTLQDVTILKIGQWGVAQAATAPEDAQEVDQQQQPPADQQQTNAQGTPTPNMGPTIMTVLVDQQDALVLKFARESGASIDFALRGRNWHDVVTTEPVTLDYMIQRFNLMPPEGLNFALKSEETMQ